MEIYDEITVKKILLHDFKITWDTYVDFYFNVLLDVIVIDELENHYIVDFNNPKIIISFEDLTYEKLKEQITQYLSNFLKKEAKNNQVINE